VSARADRVTAAYVAEGAAPDGRLRHARAVPPGGTSVITMINNSNVRNTCLFTC
jgi:hypothetical protein